MHLHIYAGTEVCCADDLDLVAYRQNVAAWSCSVNLLSAGPSEGCFPSKRSDKKALHAANNEACINITRKDREKRQREHHKRASVSLDLRLLCHAGAG